LDTKPGNTMVGTHIHRNITWAEHVKTLTNYFARNSFMLQRGRYVADVAYLLNEGAPSTMPFWGAGLQPAMPKGYQFDYINADVLLNLMSVNSEGQLTLPGGMTYSVLVLPQSGEMTWAMVNKIKELIRDGATVMGPRPVRAPGLSQYPASDSAIKEIAFEIWGDLDGISRTKRSYGKGKIAWGLTLEQVLNGNGVNKDLALNYDNEQVSWIHRRDGNTDIYFLVNRTNTTLDLSGRFRVDSRNVAIWNPDDGSIGPVSYNSDSTSTTVSMQLTAHGAVFVVFQNKAVESVNVVWKPYAELKELAGAWDLNFPKGWGAPGTVSIPQLASWTENTDEGIKYFSGTGTYLKIVEVKKEWLNRGARIILDLGVVKDMAEVYVNGKRLAFLWKSPFQVDITDVVKAGNNKLQVLVTNQWTNRLVGDREYPERKVLASYPPPFGRRQYELSESGLIGPVKLLTYRF
jgi:hypothetical protein